MIAAAKQIRSFFRLLWRLAALALLTLILIPLQLTAAGILPQIAQWLPVFYHTWGTRIVGLNIRQLGKPANARPLLIVANHVSWLDIPLITTALSVSFIAKREVRSWPVFGLLARLQRSVFIDRARPRQSANANSEIAKRLLAGDAMVLFAEGTSSDGRDVLPFRSALIGAATEACAKLPCGSVFIQPLAVSYVGNAGHIAPWYGDMDLLPHFAEVLRTSGLQAILSWGEPIAYFGQSDRKQVAKELEAEIRALMRRVRTEYA